MDKPFAITPEVGSSLAYRTGSWRAERPRTGRTNKPGAPWSDKEASRAVDAWLDGARPYEPPGEPEPVAFDRLHTWNYSDAPPAVRPRLETARRTSTFDEVVGGLDAATALYEARRCLSCGSCFDCDNCYGMCPDNAVRNLGPFAETGERAAASARRSARPWRSSWCRSRAADGAQR